MIKRILSGGLALVLLLSTLQILPAKTRAASTPSGWITDRDAVSGSDYTTSTALARKLDQIFDGNASIYSNKKCTDLVNVRIGTSNVPNNGVYKYVGPYGKTALSIGTSCWIYANGVYYTLFGETTGSGKAGKNSVKLDISTSATMSYENFKKWGVRQDVGALVRSNGHSVIILDYDKEGMTILEGNSNGKGLVSIRTRLWKNIKTSAAYIIQPKEQFFYETYPTCVHEFNDVGVCGKCGEEYYFEGSFNRNAAAIYTVAPSEGLKLKTRKPYTASTEETPVIPAGTELDVLGTVVNHFQETWYKVSYDGGDCYAKESDLTFARYGEQEITCVLKSPKEGAIVPRKSYPVTGSIDSKYPLAGVNAYLDGVKYATVTPTNTTTLDVQQTAINRSLSFSTLASGKHTITIEARDIHREEWVTVCVRNFITEEEVCSHKFDDAGVCKECGEDYYFEDSFIADCSGIYGVAPAEGIRLKSTKPYAAATEESELLPEGTEVEVLGSVTNHLSEAWFQVSYNGTLGYTVVDDLLWLRGGDQAITCDLTSPAEGAVVPKAAYPVTGIIDSKYLIADIAAYIDGVKYATVEVWDSTTVDIQQTAINHKLSFSSLTPGEHTITIEARDIHHEEMETICVRKFITAGNVCSHSYNRVVTAEATCGAAGSATYTCSKCSHSYTETIPALGHDWTEKITDESHLRSSAANCTQFNSYWYDCSRCSAVSTTEYFESQIAGRHHLTERIMDDHHWVSGTADPARYYYDCAYCDTMGTETFAQPGGGDLDGDGLISEDDAIYLLQHVLMPEMFPITTNVDFDGNGTVNEDDAIYLLQHVLMPEMFPI